MAQPIKTIEWRNNAIRIIDQTELPTKLTYLDLRDLRSLRQAIKELKVRGAPALGAAACLGVYLGIRDSQAQSFAGFKKELERTIAYLASSRPTARNLFWGLERLRRMVSNNQDKPISVLKKLILKEAQAVVEEDRFVCRRIGFYGARLISDANNILTICNTGVLATVDYGTALGVIYQATETGKRIEVFVCETRPLLQGSRLTTWELKRKGIPVTLICDSMAATLMRQGRIDKVIVGADRIALNGDTANKIGTYNLAVLSRYHHLPFYIAAPVSTFDLKLASGEDIPIEERKPQELTELFFKNPVACGGIKVLNPAFDVTPHNLITAIITERGIIRPPYKRNIIRIAKISV